MIEIVRASARRAATHGGCTLHETVLPAALSDCGLAAVHFLHFAPEGRLQSKLDAGALRFTSVVDGMLAYSDSLGRNERILGGEVQLLETAEQVTQTLRNPSASDELELVALLMGADEAPRNHCSQRHFSDDAQRGHLCTVVAPDTCGDALRVARPLTVLLSSLSNSVSVVHQAHREHYSLVCIKSGAVVLDDQQLDAGDCAVVQPGVPALRIEGRPAAELLIAVVPTTRPITGPTTRQ